MLPFVFDRGPTGVVSSSSKLGMPIWPRADALRAGAKLGLRSILEGGFAGSPDVPRTLAENLLMEGVPYRGGPVFGPGVVLGARGAGVVGSWSLRTGDSGRGRDGLDLLPVGLGALPGPTD